MDKKQQIRVLLTAFGVAIVCFVLGGSLGHIVFHAVCGPSAKMDDLDMLVFEVIIPTLVATIGVCLYFLIHIFFENNEISNQ